MGPYDSTLCFYHFIHKSMKLKVGNDQINFSNTYYVKAILFG